MLKRWVLGFAIAGLMTASAAAADFRLPAADAPAPALAAVPPPSDVETLDLAKIVERDADLAAGLAAEDYDLDARAAVFGGDALKAFDWVKANIRFEPYSGVLRGAGGTLAARAGNAADRALLLAALLKRMDVKTRFARAALDDAAATAVVETAFTAGSISRAAPKAEMLDAAALRAGRDLALLRPALSAEIAAANDTSLAAALAATRDHVWVEAEIGGEWTALDPAAAAAAATLTAASEHVDELPEAAYQSVTFTLSAQAISDGAVSSAEPLRLSLPAVKLAGAAVFLAFVEDPKGGGVGGALNDLMGGVKSYVPVIWVDGEPHVGKPVDGLAAAPEAVGGFLGGEEPVKQPELARLELTIETAAPDGSHRKAVRTLLDRAPGAAVIAAGTTLEPMPMSKGLPAASAVMHNIQVTTGPLNLRNGHALRALAVSEIVMSYSDPEKSEGRDTAELLWPIAAINMTLPMALENAVIPALNVRSDVKVFTGSPRVSILSTGSIDGPAGEDYRVTEVDLKLGGATVLARPDAAALAFEYRLWAGILESAVETEFGARAGQLLFVPETTTRVSASTLSDVALVRHDRTTPAVGDAPRTALAAVDGGLLVFAPAGPLAAWWEIDPATGTTRAVLAPDLGGQRSYGGYRPEPSRTLDSSWGRQRTGLNSGRGGVVHMSEDGSRSIIQGQRNLGRAASNGPPPNRCSGGSEYMTILGCVSLPAGWALKEFYALLLFDVVITATDIILTL